MPSGREASARGVAANFIRAEKNPVPLSQGNGIAPAPSLGRKPWRLLLDEGALDQVVARLAHAWRDLQAEAVENRGGFVEHAPAAAAHRAAGLRGDRRQGAISQTAAAGRCAWPDPFGLKISPRMDEPGDYLIERAFVEK